MLNACLSQWSTLTVGSVVQLFDELFTVTEKPIHVTQHMDTAAGSPPFWSLMVRDANGTVSNFCPDETDDCFVVFTS